MREILFRGKSRNSGDWVQGSLVITTIDPADDTPIKHYHIEDMTIGVFPNEYQSGLSETVDPKTVGQYTGLTDKNGNNIFEGDIVKNEYEDSKYQYFKIFYNEKTLQWEVMNKYGMRGILHNVIGNMEVIGNIHDNPELLKED